MVKQETGALKKSFLACRPLNALSVSWHAITPSDCLKQNETIYCADTFEARAGQRYLFAIADGERMCSGVPVAGRTALDIVRADLLSRRRRITDFTMADAVQQANRAVFNLAHTRPELANIKCELSIIILERDFGLIGFVGSCRLYKSRNHKLELVTGRSSGSLGASRIAEVYVSHQPLAKGESYFFCSQGIWENVPEEKIGDLMTAENYDESGKQIGDFSSGFGAVGAGIFFRINSVPVGKQKRTYIPQNIFLNSGGICST
jgi:serine/threonine protein phosphatase PrpC